MLSKLFQKTAFIFFLLTIISALTYAQKGGNSAVASYQKGVALAKKDEYTGAIAEFQKALKANPKYYEALIALGLTQQQIQDSASAAETFKKAVVLRPKSAEPHLLLGSLLSTAE